MSEKNGLIDNIMIEITSLKFAENKTFKDCIYGFMPPILEDFLLKVNYNLLKKYVYKNIFLEILL